MPSPHNGILDNFNRADSSSLGSSWSSPGETGDSSLRIGGDYCRVASGGGPSSSYWNTLFTGDTEAFMTLSGSSQNAQLMLGFISTGYYYRIRNDMLNNIIEIIKVAGGSQTSMMSNADHMGAGTKMWATMNKVAGQTLITLYFDTGSGYTQYTSVTDTASPPVSSYIGIRLYQNGQVDDFGGGSQGTNATVTSVPARATAAGLPPTLNIAKFAFPPPALATAQSVGPLPILSTPIPPGVLNLNRPVPSGNMSVPVPYGSMSLTRVPPVGHSDIPPFPPLPPHVPPPPLPPVDPRDVPALDGPFTYLMYGSMEPLTWEDEALGYPMLTFFKSIAYNMHEPYAFAVNPGWQLALDPDNVPSWWLDWLAQFVGIPVKGFSLLSSTDKRTEIKNAPGWQRGTLAAMIAAAKKTLTGNQTVIVYERYNPSTAPADAPYHITFITYLTETPDSTATLNALLAAKPGGIQLTLLSRAGQTWQTLRDHYPPTTQRLWSTVKSDYADWEHARDVTYY